ncbi:MAG: hypothetical protein C6I05_00095 [Epsilonproteobacteria bacterium]|nr:hypothetical protein [Campylobacterota bacterium]
MKIRKHNSLTDGSTPQKTARQVLPDRLINALYYKYEREGAVFELSLGELKYLLGLEGERDNERIYKAIAVLQHPIQIRDFRHGDREVVWMSAPFLARAIRYRDHSNQIEFTIDPIIIEALHQKAGYTPLDLNVCNRFKTKYGLKLYEIYRRYYTLPHRERYIESRRVGVIKKGLKELNILFGTHFKYPSQMLRAIERGVKEVRRVTGVFIHCFYARSEKLFVFSWERRSEGDPYPSEKAIIPASQLEPFIEWYSNNVVDESIEHGRAYREELRKRIIEGKFFNLKEFYRFYLEEKGYNLEECFDEERGKFTC